MKVVIPKLLVGALVGATGGMLYTLWMTHLPVACYKGPMAPGAILAGIVAGCLASVFSKP